MRVAQRFLAGVLACALVAQPLRAADLPELGDAASNELSLALEKKIGQQIMNEIRWREPSYLDDPDIENYLNQLGGRLVAASDDPGMGFQFFAIDDPHSALSTVLPLSEAVTSWMNQAGTVLPAESLRWPVSIS